MTIRAVFIFHKYLCIFGNTHDSYGNGGMRDIPIYVMIYIYFFHVYQVNPLPLIQKKLNNKDKERFGKGPKNDDIE